MAPYRIVFAVTSRRMDRVMQSAVSSWTSTHLLGNAESLHVWIGGKGFQEQEVDSGKES